MEEYQNLSTKFILESTKAFFCYSFFKDTFFNDKNVDNLKIIQNKKILRFLQRNLKVAVLENDDFVELESLKAVLNDIVNDLNANSYEVFPLHNNCKYISFAIGDENCIYEVFINLFAKSRKNPFFVEGKIIYSNYLRSSFNFKKFEPFEVFISKYTR